MDWWKRILDEREREGENAARCGFYELPYPGSYDPQDAAENAAYERGWERQNTKMEDKPRMWGKR